MRKATLRVLRQRHAALLKPFEDRFARAYRGVMRDLKAGVNLKARVDAATRREWAGRTVEALKPVYHAAILAGGKSYLSHLTIRQKAASHFVTKARRREVAGVVLSIEEQFEERLSETIDTTFDSLEEILDEAAQDGLDPDEIDDLVEEEFGDILGDRTDSIATTEMNGAINSVQDYLALQLAELHSWVTAEDDRVRPTHVIYGDAGAKPVGFDWATLIPDAGYTLRYPCDPGCHEPAEIVNCRCFDVPAGEVELPPDEMRDYLEDFEMDPEDVMVSEEQTPVYVTNQYAGKGAVASVLKGDVPGHAFHGNQYVDPGHVGEGDDEGRRRRVLNEAREARYSDLVATGTPPEKAAFRVAREQRENRMESAVQSVLTDDLRNPKYRGNPSPYAGHCYVAAEAVYHLLGGKAAGYTPQFIRHEGEPHWFLRSPDGRVIDPTRDQFKTPVPYDKASGKGFLTSKPSARAEKVLSRVKPLLSKRRKGMLASILKDFDPNQPRDEQGRWVDIFGQSQPDDSPDSTANTAQTEDPSGPDYAVDKDNPEQPQAAPPRLSDADYAAKTKALEGKAAEIAKAKEAKLQEEAQRLSKAKAELKPQLDEAISKNNALGQLREAKQEMVASKAGEEFDRAAGKAADLAQERVDVDQKRDALLGTLTEEEIAKLPDDKRAEIESLNAEHDRLTSEMSAMTDRYLKDRWGGVRTWEDGRTQYVTSQTQESEDVASQLKYDPLAMRAAADTLDKLASEMKPGDYRDGAVGADLGGRHIELSIIGSADQLKAEAAYLRTTAETNEAATQRTALEDSMSAIDRNIVENSNALGRVNTDSEMEAIASMGVDYVAERAFRDDDFYNRVQNETADEWQHIGGRGPAIFRFAADEAFGLDQGGTFDSKQGRFIGNLDDLEKTYPGAKAQAIVQAGALRREYMETQQEISEGFTFKISGGGDGDIDTDALSEMESEAWSNMSTSDKVDYVEGDKKLHGEAVEWGSDNIEEVEKLARDQDPDNEPNAINFMTFEQARGAVDGDEENVRRLDVVDRFFYGRDVKEDQRERSIEEAISALERTNRRGTGTLDNLKENLRRSQVEDDEAVKLHGQETVKDVIREVTADTERRLNAIFDTQEEADASNSAADVREARSLMEKALTGDKDAADKLYKLTDQMVAENRRWSKEAIGEFWGGPGSEIDANDLRDVDPDLSSDYDTNDAAFEAYDEKRNEWLDPYYIEAYAEADPDSKIYEKFIESYEPDEYPTVQDEGEEVTIGPEDWPHKLVRTVSADVDNYTPNYAESWAYDRQSFGSQTMTKDIDHSQILVFQGAKNWTTPEGQASMGNRENEFIVLSQPPKWVREARERQEKLATGQLRERQSAAKKAKVEALLQEYRQLQRLQDFGTSAQHYDKLRNVEALASALGVDWDTLVSMARNR